MQCKKRVEFTFTARDPVDAAEKSQLEGLSCCLTSSTADWLARSLMQFSPFPFSCGIWVKKTKKKHTKYFRLILPNMRRALQPPETTGRPMCRRGEEQARCWERRQAVSLSRFGEDIKLCAPFFGMEWKRIRKFFASNFIFPKERKHRLSSFDTNTGESGAALNPVVGLVCDKYLSAREDLSILFPLTGCKPTLAEEYLFHNFCYEKRKTEMEIFIKMREQNQQIY